MAQLKPLLSFINMQRKQLLPFLSSLLFLILAEAALFFPALFYAALSVALFFVFFAIWQFAYNNLQEKKYLYFLILPLLFVLNLFMFMSVWPYKKEINMIAMQLLLIVGAVFLFAYLRLSYFYFVKPYLYREADFINISSFGAFLAFYFASTAAYASISYGQFLFFNLPIWTIIIYLIIIAALITYQSFWSEKIDINFYYIFIVCLIISELAWALAFLPLSQYLNGFILAVFYYLANNLVKLKLLNGLNNAVLKRYVSFCFVIIIIILLTGRWL